MTPGPTLHTAYLTLQERFLMIPEAFRNNSILAANSPARIAERIQALGPTSSQRDIDSCIDALTALEVGIDYANKEAHNRAIAIAHAENSEISTYQQARIALEALRQMLSELATSHHHYAFVKTKIEQLTQAIAAADRLEAFEHDLHAVHASPQDAIRQIVRAPAGSGSIFNLADWFATPPAPAPAPAGSGSIFNPADLFAAPSAPAPTPAPAPAGGGSLLNLADWFAEPPTPPDLVEPLEIVLTDPPPYLTNWGGGNKPAAVTLAELDANSCHQTLSSSHYLLSLAHNNLKAQHQQHRTAIESLTTAKKTAYDAIPPASWTNVTDLINNIQHWFVNDAKMTKAAAIGYKKNLEAAKASTPQNELDALLNAIRTFDSLIKAFDKVDQTRAAIIPYQTVYEQALQKYNADDAKLALAVQKMQTRP